MPAAVGIRSRIDDPHDRSVRATLWIGNRRRSRFVIAVSEFSGTRRYRLYREFGP